jgi:spermidine/putrescine ABC transporter ATP-binding subunit
MAMATFGATAAAPPASDAATAILVERLWKTYGQVPAVAGIDLSISDGEFCTILGPSGSGKTTTLMMLAGFVRPTRGRIVIAGRDLTFATPQKRDLGVVFQNYALFPHMSVAANIAFPLEMRGVPRPEIRERIARILKLVDLAGMAERMPRQLSGGQQQRVALARALVFEPSVLLMDEPLGALDKQLRAHLQIELKELQRRLGVTVVYVTHDQEEALTMADHIVVMRNGRIEQSGPPEALYERPDTAFVATFIGESNLIKGTLTELRDGVGMIEQPTGRRVRSRVTCPCRLGDRVTASVRPERITIASEGSGDDAAMNAWDGRIESVVYLGEAVRYHVVVDENRPSLAQHIVVKDARAARTRFEQGEKVRLLWPMQHTHAVSADVAEEARG